MILERITELCRKNRITVAKLERETGISNGAISRWAKSSPTVGNLRKVADYFGVSVDYLIGRDIA